MKRFVTFFGFICTKLCKRVATFAFSFHIAKVVEHCDDQFAGR